MTKTYTGKCLCGDVRYTANRAPVIVAQCHCEECRRLSGTGHTVGAMFPKGAVEIKGRLSEFSYVSGQGSTVTRGSCATCGSPISGANTKTPEHITLTLGTLDGDHNLDVQVVIFDRDRQHWDELDGDVSRFATQPDWAPKS